VIVGLGTDIIEVDRIAKMIADHGDHFLQRIFTAAEIEHCQPRREAAQHFAGRWAAKEAVMKALGTGFTPDVGWTDIEILVKPSGQPFVVLHGTTRACANGLGIGEILITISHTRTVATATAVGLSRRSGSETNPGSETPL
jgi:holo-[acyl-carrier protein] synthase